jgi:hypothetical protein
MTHIALFYLSFVLMFVLFPSLVRSCFVNSVLVLSEHVNKERIIIHLPLFLRISQNMVTILRQIATVVNITWLR